jgi:pyruvate/2-oxoglutarate/acetoin dehydrogenase E1 component
MPTYYDELCRAMEMLSMRGAIFLGQAVAAKGTGMTASFVKCQNLIELPVCEDVQMGMSIGLALAGELPVSVYPRWNFLLCATNQLVSHLDRLPLFSDYRPRVIIRTASAASDPMNPGPQHLGDFSDPFRLIFKTVKVVRLVGGCHIFEEYERAADALHSTILVEYPAQYADKA